VRVRLLRINGVDLNLFEFDFDLTWTAFFMNTSNKIYGRFGGRDAKGADTRNSLEGLNYAMAAALAEHRKDPTAKPDAPARKPFFIESMPSAKQYKGCIHCHQVKEIVRADEQNAGTWNRDSIFTYPLPENVGVTLDLHRGNLVRAVTPGSAADKAGVKSGDFLRTLNKVPVNSFADAVYGLHHAPAKGEIPVAYERDGKTLDGTLMLAPNWRRTNITWRPSLLDMLPAMALYGDDLNTKEKKALGLDEKRLAFRQDDTVNASAKAMGVKAGDIIIGVDNKVLEMSMLQFLGHVRQNYLVGESLTLNVVRNGKRIDLNVKLK